jgi:hypothetical protein
MQEIQDNDPLEGLSNEEQLERLQEAKELFRSLGKSLGWGQLVRYMNETMEGNKNALLQPAADFSAMLEAERIKGMLSGIQLVLQFPDLAVEGFEQEIDQLKLAIEGVDDE